MGKVEVLAIGAAVVGAVYLFNVEPAAKPRGERDAGATEPLQTDYRGVLEPWKQASIWLLQPRKEGDRFNSEDIRQFIRHKGFTCEGVVKAGGSPKISEISCGLTDCNSGYIYQLKDYGGNLLVTPWTENRYTLCELEKSGRWRP